MTKWLRLVAVLVLVLAACGGSGGLDADALAQLRASNDFLDEFTDQQLNDVADSLCEGFESFEENETASVIDVMDQAWSAADVEDVGIDEMLASFELAEAACPDALTPELAADGEPIPMSFTLLGSEGEEFTYSSISGCEGEGGYSDVKEGMLFNLTDEQGNILGVARLDESDETSIGCEISGYFSVTFGELDDDNLYFVGDRAGNRGELAYTGSELRAQGSIELTLGDL